MKKGINWLFEYPENTSVWVVFIRLMAGSVFFWEGIIKFVFPNQGIGRFTKIGIPLPEFMSNFVAVLEIVGGLMIIVGLYTRFISIPFIIQMTVAILSTKIAIFLGNSPLGTPPSPPQAGFFAFLHESRTDFAQITCMIFLLLVGPGSFSLDYLIYRKRNMKSEIERL